MPERSDAGAEAWVLTTEAGRDLLAEIAPVERPGPSDLDRWRKRAPADRVAAAVRLATCRRRGVAKFTRADRMWLEPTALEQATAEPVALHKARRFRGAAVVVDLCAGLGGDSVALASTSGGVLAVDLDPGMVRRIAWNAGVYEVADRVVPVRARAERFPLPAGSLIHVDPDRRAGSASRARHLRDYVPGLNLLKQLPGQVRGGGLKFGPASDFATHFGTEGFEVELISLAGECKEATVWFGDLASCHRRATCLPAGASWTDHDGQSARPLPPAPPGPWIFDPDAALIRSGLLDTFAAAHDLARLDSGVDLLTGSGRVASPFLTAFEVRDILPLDLKQLRRLVSDRRLGPLEIKTRGLSVTPEQWRARLRPGAGNSATLFLIGGQGPAYALLVQRATNKKHISVNT